VLNKIELTEQQLAIHKFYYDYLFHVSPWKNLYSDGSDILNTGVAVTTEAHQGLFFQANVALRLPWEYWNRATAFEKFYDELEITNLNYLLILALSFDSTGRQNFMQGHTPLLPNMMSVEGVKAFILDKKPTTTERLYKDYPTYKDANFYWDPGQQQPPVKGRINLNYNTGAQVGIDPFNVLKGYKPTLSFKEWAKQKLDEILGEEK
jgi:hypothetical protein